MKFRLCPSPNGCSGTVHSLVEEAASLLSSRANPQAPPLERPSETHPTFTQASTTKDGVRRYCLQIRLLFALLQYACLVSAKAYLQGSSSLQAEAERPVSRT